MEFLLTELNDTLGHIKNLSEGNKDFFTSLRLERNNYGFDLEPVV